MTNNGGDIEAVIADAVAQVTERVSQAVENGRLTQEEADARIAEHEAGFRALLNGELPTSFAQESDAL
ncbi:MAG: hypothetical protein HC828_20680 [Blastochloris sp.]|nr:hypothetical protein [Blastochloris sp.]